MRFRPRRAREEPEINLIPLIDVLLVILIFLMITTTYSRYTELKVNLPTAEAEKATERPGQIVVSVTANGVYPIRNGKGKGDFKGRPAAFFPITLKALFVGCTVGHWFCLHLRVGLGKGEGCVYSWRLLFATRF